MAMQKRVTSRGTTYSDISESWEDDFEFWGSLWPIKGTEYHQNRQNQTGITHKIMMRFQLMTDGTRITSKIARVRYYDPWLDTERYFEIEDMIDMDEKHSAVQLMVVEQI